MDLIEELEKAYCSPHTDRLCKQAAQKIKGLEALHEGDMKVIQHYRDQEDKLRGELDKRHDAQLVIDRLRLELEEARHDRDRLLGVIEAIGLEDCKTCRAQKWAKEILIEVCQTLGVPGFPTDSRPDLTERDRYREALEELRGFAEHGFEYSTRILSASSIAVLYGAYCRTPVDTALTEVYDDPGQDECPKCQGIGRVVITEGQSADDTCPACGGGRGQAYAKKRGSFLRAMPRPHCPT